MSKPSYKRGSLDTLNVAIDQSYEMIEMGEGSFDELQRQKHKLLNMTDRVDDMDETITNAGYIINKIHGMLTNQQYMSIGIIIVLSIVIGVLLYFRLK